MAIGGFVWFRSRRLSTAELLKRMPTIESLVVYIDFDKLRQAGMLELLDGSKAGEDPEYRAFAQKTNFHWEKDLDRRHTGGGAERKIYSDAGAV